MLAAINSYGHTGLLDLGGGTTVSPRQLLGLELNPRAAAVADVVLRIGYLQWHLRTHGITQLAEPLLDEFQNIRQQDAALQHDPPTPRLDAQGRPVTRWDGSTRLHPATGQRVPDETARTPVLDYPNPQPADWPEADFIVGNPPFVGNKRMRDLLGDGYSEALRKAYAGRVPESADLVMYWWDNAAEALRSGKTERFGFITTNSITQTFNRKVMQRHMEADSNPVSLFYAIPDHPWVDAAAGAAVRVAMTVAQPGMAPGTLALVTSETVVDDEEAHDVSIIELPGIINSDLSNGADVTTVKALKANSGISGRGVIPYGKGFLLSEQEAQSLGVGRIDGLDKLVRPYRNGKDLTAKPRGVYAIDLFGLTATDVLQRFPEIYQHLLVTVKPERDVVSRVSRRDNWWLFAENQPAMRRAVAGLARYIATVYVAKHRFFMFVDGAVLPDDGLIAIGTDDGYYLGILSSRFHIIWSLEAGGRMGVGNDPRYNSNQCFLPFPFPAATPAQQARIRELAEQLDAHRKRQQAQHATLTLTDLYNVVEKLRAGQPLSTKEQAVNQQGLASVVLSLHKQLDVAVAEAYGWPADLPDAELLTRLVRLNHERAREEQAGHVRYLRPSYQAPEQQQATLTLPAGVAAATMATATGPQPWPAELAQQMQVLRDALQQAGQPLTPVQVAARFKRLKPAKVHPLLNTLAALSLLRHSEVEGTYVA